jgi:DEAD/DEAH box helicase domain-containing protein
LAQQLVVQQESADSLLATLKSLEVRRTLDAEPVLAALRRFPPEPGIYAEFPDGLHPKLREVLARRGIERLYVHQREAYDAAAAGRHVVVVTPTASGKTLCYNLPVLDGILKDPDARALYLFPTKALSQDQLAELHGTVEALGADIGTFTYDGDTPQDARKAIRARAHVVVTNPDMLHKAVLPHHTKWVKLLENLRYVVIDELHYYRGVYGSHLANILRRMRRICEFYGSKPQFVCSSATIANPKALAETLTGEEFTAVERNGAPAGERYFVFLNPPVVNRQLGIRRSYLHEARRIAQELIERGQQTLVFCNNRLATEILVTYLKDACERLPMGGEMVRGYRGGYLPKERREIERLLRDGAIRAVVATNALELGIDIGSLDGVVMAGYPGTIASTWQRAGRAGRRQTASLVVLVASSAPLDQFIVEHPDYFFGQPPESAHANPDNLEILINHLKCAAFELPVTGGEKFGPHDTSELCGFLRENGLLHHSGGAWHWTSDTYPADAISLRSVSSDNFVVVDETGEPRVIAELAFPAALEELHEKAIYLHEARQYQVERFDYENRKAYVRRVECDYYTDAIEYTQVKELDRFDSVEVAGAHARHGEVRVNRQVVGFKKIKFYTNENVGAGHLSLPETEMHTTAFWLHFPAAFLAQLPNLTPTEKQAGLIGICAAFRAVGALLLMCDPRDLGVALTEDIEAKPRAYEPSLFLYDDYPGGVGLSAPLHASAGKLIAMSGELIRKCACESGCPSCVGPLGDVGERGKEAALRILDALAAV